MTQEISRSPSKISAFFSNIYRKNPTKPCTLKGFFVFGGPVKVQGFVGFFFHGSPPDRFGAVEVVNFLCWAAEPAHDERKLIGLKVAHVVSSVQLTLEA